MSNFKKLLPLAILTLACAVFGLGALAVFCDWVHPRLPCLGVEKTYWNGEYPGQQFEKVSSYFWSSLCRPHSPPLVVSASEGTGFPSFPQLINDRWKIKTDEFQSAYRGIKTIGYMLANDIHPSRLKNLRMLGLINPVYFSFAAHTDSATIRVNSISNFSYVLRVHSFVQTWDEFLLDSFYISAREYLDELRLFEHPAVEHPLAPVGEIQPMADSLFEPSRNMYKERAEFFKSFTSRFQSTEQPTRLIFENTVAFMKAHPEVPICLVLLPINVENLQYFGRDSKAIVKDMQQMFAEVPAGQGVDLQYLNEQPKIFRDPMHLTKLGKLRVMEEVMKTPCAKKVFGDGGRPSDRSTQ